jgi:hypothetical protein
LFLAKSSFLLYISLSEETRKYPVYSCYIFPSLTILTQAIQFIRLKTGPQLDSTGKCWVFFCLQQSNSSCRRQDHNQILPESAGFFSAYSNLIHHVEDRTTTRFYRKVLGFLLTAIQLIHQIEDRTATRFYRKVLGFCLQQSNSLGRRDRNQILPESARFSAYGNPIHQVEDRTASSLWQYGAIPRTR